MAEWIEIEVSAFEALLSTGKAQPLARDKWPEWAQCKHDYTGMWLYPVLDPLTESTGTLSTGNIYAYIDAERHAIKGKPLRYYRYHFARTIDDRVFQWSEPDKDIEYGHHRDDRPLWLGSHYSASTG